MPAKKPPNPKDKPQSERFIDAAKSVGVDTEAFDRAMEKITPPRAPKKPRA